MIEITDKTRDEFFSEAQEIIETLSRNLLSIDAMEKQGRTDPSLVNEAFRAVHTLKGLAGLFGATRIGSISHTLEDLLDDVRLGRQPLTVAVLDVLFVAVEAYHRLLAAEKSSTDEPIPVLDELLTRLAAIGGAVPSRPTQQDEYDLDPGMLAVLTEYEEHRLRSNIEQGLNLYRLRVAFDLNTIDKALEEIKDRAKLHGEIITYLPTGDVGGGDTIDLDLMMASSEDLAVLVGALGADNIVIEAVPRRRRPTVRPMGVPAVAVVIEQSEPAPAAGGGLSVRREDEVPVPVVEHHEASLRSVTQTVRVDIRKLDHLMNIVGELAIVRSALSRLAERLRAEGQRQFGSELMRMHRSFDRRLAELQDGILEVRMVPLGQVFDRLARVVRQISRDAGKEIRLVITGAETEIDKLIVEELSDPLMHMIRNAIDHGIEKSDVRASVGKPTAGTIALNAFQKGNHVMIEIEDDGAGIDEAVLLTKAVAMGKVGTAEASDLSRDELLALIFLPGLSTRDAASDLSGRGVGMDVVKTNIGKLGGVIDVQSERGIGTKLTITLPITLAIVSALIVDVAGRTYAIPLATVSEAIRLDESGVRVVDGREVMTLRGSTLPLCRLHRLLRLDVPPGWRRQFVVVAAVGNRRLGLVVDDLFGQQDIVIKPLGRSLREVRGFSGATELGDQRVGLVIDAAALIDELLTGFETRERSGGRRWVTS
ncbi:MAG: chemotaxis protein CheA [Polyangiaceae bacterium]|nr:chemotaxis protein CheA [Polyangiaceae bacterium]